MNNVIGSFEENLERGKSSVRKAAKVTGQGAQNFAKTASNQVSPQPSPQQGTNEAGVTSSQQMSDDDAKKFLQDLYGVKNTSQNQQANQSTPVPVSQKPQSMASQQNVKTVPTPTETIKTAMGIPEPPPQKTNPTHPQSSIATAIGLPQKDPNAGKTPEELAKIEALRQQLHKNYYESLTNSKKPEEEHVTEKLEREGEEEKMSELEVQKKKPPPIAVQRVQQSAEKFRGVSG